MEFGPPHNEGTPFWSHWVIGAGWRTSVGQVTFEIQIYHSPTGFARANLEATRRPNRGHNRISNILRMR